MGGKRERVGPTWAERQAEAQALYSRMREEGQCKVCGVRGVYLKAGPHPSGKRGQPVRLAGPDVEDVRQWIEAAGFVCQRCSQVTGGAGGGSRRTARGELASIRKELEPLKKMGMTPELCQAYKARNLQRMSEGAFQEWVSEAQAAGRWMEPERFQRLLDRERELSKTGIN